MIPYENQPPEAGLSSHAFPLAHARVGGHPVENVLENLEKIHPEFHHFEDLVKALDECANRETILHIEISPLVKDHREFLNEQPRVTASGSRHVHFALEPPEIMDV